MGRKFSTLVPKSVVKSIKAISLPWRQRIIKAIDTLESSPYAGEKMHGKLKEKYKIRVWPYCIIYAVDKKKGMAIILEVNHRGSISYH